MLPPMSEDTAATRTVRRRLCGERAVARAGRETEPRHARCISIVAFGGGVCDVSICVRWEADGIRPGDPLRGRTRSRAVQLTVSVSLPRASDFTPIKRVQYRLRRKRDTDTLRAARAGTSAMAKGKKGVGKAGKRGLGGGAGWQPVAVPDGPLMDRLDGGPEALLTVLVKGSLFALMDLRLRLRPDCTVGELGQLIAARQGGRRFDFSLHAEDTEGGAAKFA